MCRWEPGPAGSDARRAGAQEVMKMTEFASILWIAVPVLMLIGMGLCMFRAARSRRGGESRWGCCCGKGGPGDVTGR